MLLVRAYVLRIPSGVLQELLDHLEGMLSNEAVVVTVGQAIVEVKPQVGDPVAVLARLHSSSCHFKLLSTLLIKNKAMLQDTAVHNLLP